MDDDVVFERDGREEDGRSEEELESMESRVDSKLQKVKRELDATKKEKQEYLDGWQRAKADYVNAVKRFEEEKKLASRTGVEKAVSALLPAFDALERAKAAGDVPEGFIGIAKQLETAFSGLGLTPFGAVGEAFDPALHEALGTDPATEKSHDDTVSVVLEQGYRLGDAVLRPARVRVFQHNG